MRWGLYIKALHSPHVRCHLHLGTWSVGGKASSLMAGAQVHLQVLLLHTPLDFSPRLSACCSLCSWAGRGLGNVISFILQKRSQDGNPGPKIKILVLALLVGFRPCELSWSISIPIIIFLLFSYSFSFLLLKCICGVHVAAFCLWAAFPWGPNPPWAQFLSFWQCPTLVWQLGFL